LLPYFVHMKKLLLVFSMALCSVVLFAQEKPPAAKDILNEAYKKAAAENKNVLLIFHASWCGWCHKMDSSINNPSCKKSFTDNYVITHLVVHEFEGKKDLENAGAEELLKQYKAFDKGIPFWVVLDKNGKLLQDSFIKNADGSSGIIGCPASEKEVAAFINILKATSAMNADELAVITSVFRKNEVQ
jgi:thioredoxin-related protein